MIIGSFLTQPSRTNGSLSARPHTPLIRTVYSATSPRLRCHRLPGTESHDGVVLQAITVPRAPSPERRRYLHLARDSYPRRQALPRLCRSYGLMRRTEILPRPRVPPCAASLCRWLRALLLAVGPSRRYLRESFSRCLDPYPGAPHGASTRFFPWDIGLPHFLSGSACHKSPAQRRRCGGCSRGCSHSLMFRPPGLLATQVVPTAWYGSHTKGSRDFYVHAYLGSLPHRAVDMLAVRIEQLTAEGLSPSKIRGLAGRS